MVKISFLKVSKGYGRFLSVFGFDTFILWPVSPNILKRAGFEFWLIAYVWVWYFQIGSIWLCLYTLFVFCFVVFILRHVTSACRIQVQDPLNQQFPTRCLSSVQFNPKKKSCPVDHTKKYYVTIPTCFLGFWLIQKTTAVVCIFGSDTKQQQHIFDDQR